MTATLLKKNTIKLSGTNKNHLKEYFASNGINWQQVGMVKNHFIKAEFLRFKNRQIHPSVKIGLKCGISELHFQNNVPVM